MSEINRARPIQCRAVHFKNRLLLAVMKQLAGNAAISFEGDLSSLDLLAMPGTSDDETLALKRSTASPRQDFVIFPLELDTIQPIIRAIGGTIPKSILHIQIAKADKLEFGAYDQFDPGALFIGEALGGDFLDVMVSEGILER